MGTAHQRRYAAVSSHHWSVNKALWEAQRKASNLFIFYDRFVYSVSTLTKQPALCIAYNNKGENPT
jgi:hypothetical protein